MDHLYVAVIKGNRMRQSLLRFAENVQSGFTSIFWDKSAFLFEHTTRTSVGVALYTVLFSLLAFSACAENQLHGDAETQEAELGDMDWTEENFTEDATEDTDDIVDDTLGDASEPIDGVSQTAWVRIYGTGDGDETISSIRSTTDGGYITAGTTAPSGVSSADFWVLKIDELGQIQWQRAYGETESDQACCIEGISDEGFVVAGTSRSFGSGDETTWILNLDGRGDIVWQRTLASEQALGRIFSLRHARDGGIYIAGRYDAPHLPEEDRIGLWVVKVSGDGEILWQKSLATIHTDGANSIQETADGGVILTGYTQIDNFEIIVVKLNEAGDVVWAKTYGNAGNDQGYAVISTWDDGFIIAGEMALGRWDESEPFLMKLDEQGRLLWPMSYGDLGDVERSIRGSITDIRQTLDRGFIASVIVNGNAYPEYASAILKLNEDGHIAWGKLVDRPRVYYDPIFDNLYSVIEAVDGGYVAAGNTGYNYPGLVDAMIVKVRDDGRFPQGCPPGIGDDDDALMVQDCDVLSTSPSLSVRETGFLSISTNASWHVTNALSEVVCLD